uniref:Mono-/di-acylglycerol lipase N-terminal domain-containing protein n=1 Tax=Aegilops tauschii TaxID=37682 RepID=M8AT42_AEGTA
MGAKWVASSAAGTAALVYVVLSGRLSPDGAEEAPRRRHGRRDVDGESEARWPESAPASWREAAAVAARTLRFAYGETLGKWPLGDIAFGISHYMRLQINA